MRFGLLGTGRWARVAHGPALASHPRVRLVGVWGRRAEAARELAGALATRPYGSVDALLAECDAVALALPPDVQAPLAARAASAGRHLLLDKPVATTVPAARRLADAVAAAGVASVVFLTLRFARETAAWVAAQAATGGWLTGRVDWLSPALGGAAGARLLAASPWRRERGALWDVGPHALSLLLPPLGDVATAGSDQGRGPGLGAGAVTAARGPGDMVHLTLRHASGASSVVTLSQTVPRQASGVVAELRGTAGVSTLPERSDAGPLAPLQQAIDALLAAAGTGRHHPCDVRFGLRVTEILAAAQAALPPTSPTRPPTPADDR